MTKWLFLLLMYALPGWSTEHVPDASSLEVKTPTLAERKTAKIRLGNGLEAYLISDPGTHKSGAALAVEVGSWDDPEGRPGMAHFVEHLLFLGTEKYPKEEEYEHYLDTHAGQRNAFTADDRTVYIFSVDNGGFAGALDRFSQFFVAPLFTPSGVERETIAIEQEFQKDVPLDVWRALHVHKELGNPDHPFHTFSIGNKSTLAKISREELIKWYRAHYSAHLMHLVVYAPLPLDELEAQVTELFTKVPTHDWNPPTFEEPLLSGKTAGKLIAITPYQDLQMLDFTWELPAEITHDTEAHPDHVVSYVLGHEGETSLLALLKRKELAESLATGTYHAGRKQHLFTLSIHLTGKGLEQYDQVISHVFEALASTRTDGIPRYIYDEIVQMEKLRYMYQQREDVFTQVSRIATQMVDEPLETFPLHTLIPTTYAPEKMEALLASLTPERCHFTLMARPNISPFKVTHKEQWMRVPYSLNPLPTKRLTQWSHLPPHKAICTSRPNRFVPQNLDLLDAKEKAHPQLLAESAGGALYHMQDSHFRVPEVVWSCTLYTPAIQLTSARTQVMADLYCHAVQERLNALAYEASLAGLHYTLKPAKGGLRLHVRGYSDKAPQFIASILSEMKGTHPSLEEFILYKDLAIREYGNAATKTPIAQGMDLLLGLLYKHHIGPSDKLEALPTIVYDDFVAFSEEVLQETYLKTTSYGNLSDELSETLWKTATETLGSSPYPKESHPAIEVAALSDTKDPAFLVRRSHLPGNVLILTADCGPFSFQKRASQELLAKGLETPFFNELRTRQQTGYIVTNWSQEIERHLYAFFLVQSSTHDTRDLLSRFELFLESSLHNLSEHIPEERFNTLKSALITQLENPAEQMSKMGELMHSLAVDYDGDFDWLDQRIAGLQELTYKQFLEDAHTFLGTSNKKRLAVGINGTLPHGDRLHYRRITSPTKLRNEFHYSPR